MSKPTKRRPAGKLVRLSAFEPIGLYKDAEQPWSDTWVRYSIGRKKVEVGPTICGMSNLLSDKGLAEFMLAEPDMADDPEFDLEFWRNELRDWQDIETAVNVAGVYFQDESTSLPTVWVKEEYVTRSVAERAVAALLSLRGHTKLRFKWERVNHRSMVCPA